MHGSFPSNKLMLKVENWRDIRDRIMPVWKMHNDEIASPSDRALFSPDWAKFDNIAENGQDHWVTIRHFGTIIGYSFAMVTTHLHRKNTLCGFFDLYWLNPGYRKGTTAGKQLLTFSQDTLVERGVKRIYIGTKVWRDIGPLLERMGYAEAEHIYTRSF